MFFKFVIYAFLIYLLYKFIFELVIPVSKATSQVKDRMREMQEQQLQQQRYQEARQRQHEQHVNQTTASAQKKDEDYIDFEEVKP